VLRIRNRSFGSNFGSGSGLKLVSDPDSNPDLNPGFGSRSETGQNFFFFCSKFFLPSLIFKHKKVALPQLRDLAMNKVRINLQDSDPDPLVRGTDPRIRILTKSKGSTTLRTTICKSFLLYCDSCYSL
jgi:hypothetical protein